MVAGAGTLLADDVLKRIDAHAFFLWRVTIRSLSSRLRRGGSPPASSAGQFGGEGHLGSIVSDGTQVLVPPDPSLKENPRPRAHARTV